MRPSAIAPIIAVALTLVAARPAAGHAFLQRYDLPLPLWHYLVGTGLVIASTFVFLAIFRGVRAGHSPRRCALSMAVLGPRYHCRPCCHRMVHPYNRTSRMRRAKKGARVTNSNTGADNRLHDVEPLNPYPTHCRDMTAFRLGVTQNQFAERLGWTHTWSTSLSLPTPTCE